MGMFFPHIDPPSGCQLCRFAPIIITPRKDGGYIKEQFCLITREPIQTSEVDNETDFPDGWFDDKHLECPGFQAEAADEANE